MNSTFDPQGLLRKFAPQTTLTLGPLTITFHKTERVADTAQNAALPPSLGHFSIYKVAQFQANCPSSWDPNGIFLPVQKTEAMWMSFRQSSPVALTVGAGGINAVTGKKLAARLEDNAYLTCPPQPWLDGWKNTDGTVRQFVCAEYKGGEGVTVGEQLIGSESKTGGIAIAVFEPAKPLPTIQTPPHHSLAVPMAGAGPEYALYSTKSFGAESTLRRASKSMAEMGVGAGGKITQKIYPDPYGLAVWKATPSFIGQVYLVSAEDFAEITGQKLATPAEQSHPGFQMVDGHMADVPGTSAFDNLKPATSDVSKTFFPG